MIRPVLGGFAGGILLLLGGVGELIYSATTYLASPMPMSSAIGLPVFSVDGVFVQYQPWRMGAEALLMGGGIVVIVASLVVAAAMWRPGNDAAG